MLEGSFWELALIFVLALIVFGPERLPGLARTMGLWIGRARAVLRNLSDQLERELAADEMRKTAADAKREINSTLNEKISLTGTDQPGNQTQPTVKRDDATG
ncbi:MAG: Sec-independent protein translocase protein TatB [Gammaproteobacteria bacterium]